MLKELTKLANHLDQKGLTKEADYLDNIIKEAAAGENVFRFDSQEGLAAQRAQRRRENPEMTDEFISELSGLDAHQDESFREVADQLDEGLGTEHPKRFQPKNKLDVTNTDILPELWGADSKDFPETILFFKQIKPKVDLFIEENELPSYSSVNPITLDKASSEFLWSLQDVVQGTVFSGDITLRITQKEIYKNKKKFEVFTSFISDEKFELHPKLESLSDSFSIETFMLTDNLEEALSSLKEQINQFKDYLI
jgi:hypothetical protein